MNQTFFVGVMNRPATLSPLPFSRGIYACSLDSVTGELSHVFTEPVALLESPTFYGCRSLTSVVIPKGVMVIGEYAFSNCDHLKIHAPKGSKGYKRYKYKKMRNFFIEFIKIICCWIYGGSIILGVVSLIIIGMSNDSSGLGIIATFSFLMSLLIFGIMDTLRKSFDFLND